MYIITVFPLPFVRFLEFFTGSNIGVRHMVYGVLAFSAFFFIVVVLVVLGRVFFLLCFFFLLLVVLDGSMHCFRLAQDWLNFIV